MAPVPVVAVGVVALVAAAETHDDEKEIEEGHGAAPGNGLLGSPEQRRDGWRQSAVGRSGGLGRAGAPCGPGRLNAMRSFAFQRSLKMKSTDIETRVL